MDWSKAKNILIVVFVVVNIILMMNIGLLYRGKGISADTVKNTKAVLEDRGVVIKCELPTFNSGTGMLQFEIAEDRRAKIAGRLLGQREVPAENIKYGEELVNGSKKLIFESNSDFVYKDEKPEKNVNISNKAEVEKLIRNTLDGTGLPMSRYSLDDYKMVSENEATVIFREKYGKFLVFDNYIGAWVSKKGITLLESRFKEIKGLGPSNDILPAHVVLLKNYPKGSSLTITNIDIGFKSKTDIGMKDLYGGPSWRVITSDNAITYFSAYDGEIIK